MTCSACRTDYHLVDQSISDQSVVEIYVCFNCGAERFRALSGKFYGVETTQLGSLEAEGTDGGRRRREDS